MNQELEKYHAKMTLDLKAADQANELLASLRADCPTEDQDDIILDLMDIVTGYCLPGNLIWE